MKISHFLQWLVSSRRPDLALYGKPCPERLKLDAEAIRTIVWVRTDSIGDAVLAMDQLRILGEAFPGVRIHVVCQEHLAELYGACPWVASILCFQRRRFRKDRGYRNQLLRRVEDLKADLSLNGVYSRETLTDAIALAAKARFRCVWSGDAERAEPWKLRSAEHFYSHVFQSGDGLQELERNKAFMENLGLQADGFRPRVWLTEEDLAFARARFQAEGLDPARTVGFFAGTQKAVRQYAHFGTALALAFPERDIQVLALGTAEDGPINQNVLDVFGAAAVNLSGATTLRQSAALLASCRLAVGSETGLMHLAAAVGTPQAVILGGGHFGRFAPCTPLTSAACLPMTCYGCGWRCPYPRAHCVTDVPPESLADAIRNAFTSDSPVPRVYFPGDPTFSYPAAGPTLIRQPSLPSPVAWIT
jgi:ADP-heptose:LPS heptosyltransferase